ncbi:MAG TPA: hypothetical protein VFW63_04255 [Acidimicrobiales bacterium]|nr:hypothetical protein [Acidimicrobiales bacterium]
MSPLDADDFVPELVPARMVNEFCYCPRLFHLEWVHAQFKCAQLLARLGIEVTDAIGDLAALARAPDPTATPRSCADPHRPSSAIHPSPTVAPRHPSTLTDDPATAAALLDKAIAGCATDEVAEIRSLAKTVASSGPAPPLV